MAAVQEEARKEVLAAAREEVQRVVLAAVRKEVQRVVSAVARKAVLVVRTEDADCMNFPGRKSKFRRAASIVPEKFYWT